MRDAINSASAMQGAAYGNLASNPQTAQPTRLGHCAAQFDGQVNQLAMVVERLCRIADRLGGPVPEEVSPPNGKSPNRGTNLAAQLEGSLEDFDYVGRRLGRIVERLETL